MEMISISRLTQQLLALGVSPGSTLLVHCVFSALQATLGLDGALAMPSMTDDDHPFDAAKTRCRGMGSVADSCWRMDGVRRSNSPHAFAARGPMAVRIPATHSADIPHGLDSLVGRVYDLDGWVLLLGVGHTHDTTVHLAEFLAGVRYRRKKSRILISGGRPGRFDYAEIDHCCQKFSKVDQWLDARNLQTRGTIGRAEARLIRSRAIVAAVTERLRENETVFLHPRGVDGQCDGARNSLAEL